jgi:hypothetical protein
VAIGPAVSDYAGASIIGPAEALMLDADDTELLVDALDELLERMESEYQSAPDRHDLSEWIDELAPLRDAIHSAVTDPDPGSDT